MNKEDTILITLCSQYHSIKTNTQVEIIHTINGYKHESMQQKIV